MPHIALEAVEQFHYKDIAFRKHYYYLSYLEPAPKFLRPEVPKSKREKLYQKEMEKAEKHEMKEQGIRPKRKLKTFAKVPLEVGSDRIGL